ncbi:MAG: HAD family phosphatase [Clostridia bacterium]|nr:HAD family phosphatase [Clostridia bacterium]
MSGRGIRMVVTDLDGTLLRNDKSISPRTQRAVARLRERGVLFVAATARPIRGVRGFLPDLSCDGALYHNGAVVVWGDERLEGFGVERPLDVVRAVRADDPARWVAVEVFSFQLSKGNAPLSMGILPVKGSSRGGW